MRRFPRGFKSWHKAHYHAVKYINDCIVSDNDPESMIYKVMQEQGLNGLYQLSVEWATLFEFEHRNCDEKDDHSYAVRNFCELRNYPW
jgi:hypothetical protein